STYTVTILFHPRYQWRLVEEYGTDSFTPTPDGRLRFVGTFPDEDSILSWLLTFGDGAELLEPPALRTRLRQLGEALARQYQDSQDSQNPKEASPWHPTKRL
ncbi:MAG: WYL domain-containing protein, partial [Evtepia sp.]|nr:WYL domain-containing protein [Evtepia sp.]